MKSLAFIVHFVAAALGIHLALGAPPALAQTFPSKPVTLIVPYPPGGAADIMGRIMARALGNKLGVSVLVDNKAGAGTALGAQLVSQAAPDGYTLLISGNTTFSINPALKAKLPYDPVNGFSPVGIIGHTALVMLAHPSVQAATVKEVVALAAAQPGKLNCGSFGIGTSSHFAGEMFKVMTGVKLNHVPYKGSAPAMTDLIGGQIPFTFDTTVAAAAQMAAGKVKAIAVTSKKRVTSMPTVPTMAESGLPDFDLVAWLAIVGPKGLPESVQSTLNQALNAAMKDPAVLAELTKAGLDIDPQNAKVYHERIARELPLFRAYVHKAGIALE
jgi:tripartite-type tricarboxylate transporter receptor subunit TctC